MVSTCPEEDNPLSLDPAEVVKQNGEMVSLNCTSTVDAHEGMYWTDGINKTMETQLNSIVAEVDWDVATCKIKLKNSFECSKDLKITTYSKLQFNKNLGNEK